MQGKKKQIDKLINSTVTPPKVSAIRDLQLQSKCPPRLTQHLSPPTARYPSMAQPVVPKVFKFFALPGELRNKIYDYIFEREIYEICWLDKTKSSLTYRLPRKPHWSPTLDPSVGRRRRLLDYPRYLRSEETIPVYQAPPGPAAILLTSKMIYLEASTFLYRNATFTFHCLGTFSKFLDTINVRNKESIRSLHLKHHTAGNPSLTKNQQWKHRYDTKWGHLCWKAGDELRSLEELSLHLTINDRRFSFDEEEPWIAPLFGFTDNKLKRCSITLKGATSNETLGMAETERLRRLLLGKNFRPGEEGESLWFQKTRTPESYEYVGGYPVLRIREEDQWPILEQGIRRL